MFLKEGLVSQKIPQILARTQFPGFISMLDVVKKKRKKKSGPHVKDSFFLQKLVIYSYS